MTAYALYGEIKFPEKDGRKGFLIRNFNSCKIESSWKGLTDTAEITTPRNVQDFDKTKVSDWFREGDPVEIYLGYGSKPTLEFQGYIKRVSAGIPLKISCEDEMYQLKRRQVNVSIQSCTLKQLLQKIAPGYKIECDEVQLGNVRHEKMAASQILEDLQKQGIYCWFEGKILHAYGRSKSDKEAIDIVLEKTAGETENIKQKEVENVSVVITLIRKKGKKLKVEFGDENAGIKITRTLSGIELTEAEMKSKAKKIYDEAKLPGLDGDLTLWGLPRVQHGSKVNISSVLYPEKDGVYYIDTVTKTFSQEDAKYRQVCKLGNKASK